MMLNWVCIGMKLPKNCEFSLNIALSKFRNALAEGDECGDNTAAVVFASRWHKADHDYIVVNCCHQGGPMDVERIDHIHTTAQVIFGDSACKAYDIQQDPEWELAASEDDLNNLSTGPVPVTNVASNELISEKVAEFLQKHQKTAKPASAYHVEVWGPSADFGEAGTLTKEMARCILSHLHLSMEMKWQWVVRDVTVVRAGKKTPKGTHKDVCFVIHADITRRNPGLPMMSLAAYKANVTRRLAIGEQQSPLPTDMPQHWRLLPAAEVRAAA